LPQSRTHAPQCLHLSASLAPGAPGGAPVDILWRQPPSRDAAGGPVRTSVISPPSSRRATGAPVRHRTPARGRRSRPGLRVEPARHLDRVGRSAVQVTRLHVDLPSASGTSRWITPGSSARPAL
jgi:hypothetical protein